MLKVRKVLNNNALLAFDTNTQEEIIFIGNGVGFNQKVDFEFTPRKTDAVYRQEAKVGLFEKINQQDPIFLEISSAIIEEAKQTFDQFDDSILLPLSDHIAFAFERMNKGLVISNPFAHDISLLFNEEYAVALKAQKIIQEKTNVLVNEDEVGYITLHIHAARSDDKIADSMLFARVVNETILDIQKAFEVTINVNSLAYSRLLTHMKYMIARVKAGEELVIDMDAFTKEKYPKAYQMSKKIIQKVEHELKCRLDTLEVGYLALHIQRVCSLNS